MDASSPRFDPKGRERRRILRLVRRGKLIHTGNFLTAEVPENDPGMKPLFGEQHGSVPLEALVHELGEVHGYLWVETDGRLSYETVREDPIAGRVVEFMLRDANAYLKPDHWGVFSPGEPGSMGRQCNPSPEEVAWIRQGMLANQVYSALTWMPLESKTTDDSLLG